MGSRDGASRITLQDQRGVSILEVLIAALLLGMASAGVAVMFGTGQAFIVGEGDNRIAAALARQAVSKRKSPERTCG